VRLSQEEHERKTSQLWKGKLLKREGSGQIGSTPDYNAVQVGGERREGNRHTLLKKKRHSSEILETQKNATGSKHLKKENLRGKGIKKVFFGGKGGSDEESPEERFGEERVKMAAPTRASREVALEGSGRIKTSRQEL